MKVLLVKDVPGQGIAGDLKEVSPGYARNFLLAKKYAIVADATTIHDIQQRQEKARRLAEKLRKDALATAERMKKMTLTLYAKSGENGKLFGAVSAADVADKLKREVGIDVDKKAVEFPDQIKSLGTHEASVTLYDDVTATVRIVVVAE